MTSSVWLGLGLGVRFGRGRGRELAPGGVGFGRGRRPGGACFARGIGLGCRRGSMPPGSGWCQARRGATCATSCASGESTSTNGARFAHAAPHTVGSTMLAMPGTTVSAPKPNGPMPAACSVGSSGPRLCLLACVPRPSRMTSSSPRSGRGRGSSRAVCERSSDRWPYTGGPYVALQERIDGPERTEAMLVDAWEAPAAAANSSAARTPTESAVSLEGAVDGTLKPARGSLRAYFCQTRPGVCLKCQRSLAGFFLSAFHLRATGQRASRTVRPRRA